MAIKLCFAFIFVSVSFVSGQTELRERSTPTPLERFATALESYIRAITDDATMRTKVLIEEAEEVMKMWEESGKPPLLMALDIIFRSLEIISDNVIGNWLIAGTSLIDSYLGKELLETRAAIASVGKNYRIFVNADADADGRANK